MKLIASKRSNATLGYSSRSQSGVVFRASSVPRAQVVYKAQIIKSQMEYQIRREIEIQAHLRHVNILRLYGFFHDSERLYFMLEFAPGGDIYGVMRESPGGRFPEHIAATYIAQVARALAHMHRKHVIHR